MPFLSLNCYAIAKQILITPIHTTHEYICELDVVDQLDLVVCRMELPTAKVVEWQFVTICFYHSTSQQ